VLALLPLVTFVEIGTTGAFGVLLDTFVVRTCPVPSLLIELGERSWLPSPFARRRADKGRALAPKRRPALASRPS
jgi:putative drug exporter of the RND superfamily